MNKIPIIWRVFTPNIITISRIFMTLIFVIIAYYEYKIAAYTLGVITGLSDFVDGYVARKYNIISDLGKLLDPLADKIFLTAVLVVFISDSIVPPWIVFIILSREFIVNGLRVYATQKGFILAASKWGKAKTMTQFIFLALAGIVWFLGGFPEIIIPSFIKTSLFISSLLVAFITLLSGIFYFTDNKKIFN